MRAWDHREGVPGEFAVVVCDACGSGRTSPVPEDLAAAYPATYQQHTGASVTARVVARAIAHTARGGRLAGAVRYVVPDAELGGPVAPGSRVLDVGAGNGTAVGALLAAGAEAHGVEPDGGAVAAARAAGWTTVEQGTLETSPLRGHRWDLVRMFHVLEHVPEPAVTLRAIHGALAPGGRLVVGVPNYSSLGRRVFGPSWDGLEVPRHLMHLTPAGLRHLLDDAGFRVQAMRTTPLFGVLTGSLDARTAPGRRRQRGWGEGLVPRALAYPLEVAVALAGGGDGLVAVARPRV
jgi:2-polyprenyl-3-methyl-5-hydroxy-6-metoxy-1,4-benzoquinol methylase